MAGFLAPVDSSALEQRRPFQRLLAEAAAELGGRLDLETDYGHLGRYVAANGRERILFGNALGLNPDANAQLAADKDYTARLLAADGLPTPIGHLIFSASYIRRMRLKNRGVAENLAGQADAPELAAQLGYPLITKPNSGSEGRGVTWVDTPEDLDAALAEGFLTDDQLRIEAVCSGIDHRVMVLDGAVVAAYARLPLSVCGTGRETVDTLMAARLTELANSHRGAKVAIDDPRLDQSLARQGLRRGSVPPIGQVVQLLDNANLSTGGRLRDLTHSLAPAAAALALRATKLLGLTCAGVDILAPDLSIGIDGAAIVEVNSAPGLDYFASTSPDHWKHARAIVVQMLDR